MNRLTMVTLSNVSFALEKAGDNETRLTVDKDQENYVSVILTLDEATMLQHFLERIVK